MFRAEIQHDRETVNAFTKTQFNVYEKQTKLIMFAVSLALLLLGTVRLFGEALSLILILLGCLVFVDIANIPKRTADKMLKSASGLGRVCYGFENNHIDVLQGELKGRVEYSGLQRIVRDGSYAYLFLSRSQVHMLSLSSLEPADKDAFFTFLENKTGLKWQHPNALMRLDAKALISKLFRK